MAAFSFPFIDQQLIQTALIQARNASSSAGDGYGIEPQALTTIFTIAARLMSPKSGKEYKKDKKASTQMWKVLCRPIVDSSGNILITEHHWVSMLGMLLDITSVVPTRDFQGNLTLLTLECEEVKP